MTMPEITCTTHPAPPVAQAVSSAEAATRTYQVRTHGCQMNQHDSERLAGLLESAGYLDLAGVPESQRPASADVIVFNTCAVRENAANKLYGNLGQLRPAKLANPRLQIAVGGCLAQKEREEIQRRAPWVDVVFGTHNIGQLPVLLERARHNQTAQLEILESLETFPSMLPTRREAAYSGWVSISVGCNNTCTFCIVPALRGKEQDRAPEDVLAEVRALVASGVVEVTLLGQNVNSYGVQFGNRRAFSELLRACGDIEGLERVRFTSPHPAAFTDDVIDAMAATGNVMPSLHMPLQSGSDAVLKAMRRSYRAQKFLGILQRVREHLPDAAITTDIIVGFPGESDADFCATLEVVRQAQFASAFTFQYSIRPGTPAATMDQQIPKPVVQERYEELIRVQEQISWASNRAWEGRQVEVLVAAGEGRKDASTARLSGRAADNRLVHFALPPPARRQLESASARADHRSAASLIDPAWPRPGDLVTVGVTYGAPHHLVADTASAGGLFRVRRTAGGDAWEAAQGSPTGKPAVSLGLPAVGPPPQRRAAASGRQASPC